MYALPGMTLKFTLKKKKHVSKNSLFINMFLVFFFRAMQFEEKWAVCGLAHGAVSGYDGNRKIIIIIILILKRNKEKKT